MSNKYCDLTGSNPIKEDFKKITTGFDNVEKDATDIRTQIISMGDSSRIALENGYASTFTKRELFESGGINSMGSKINETKYIRTVDFLSTQIINAKMISTSVLSFIVVIYDLNGGFITRELALKNYIFNHSLYKYIIVIYHTNNFTIIDVNINYKELLLLDTLQSTIPFAMANDMINELNDLKYANTLVNGVITPTKTNFITEGKNKINLEKTTDGYYVDSNTGGLVVNASYQVSDYISVAAGERWHSNHHYSIVFYNQDKTYFGGINSSVTSVKNYTLVPGEIAGLGLDAVYTIPTNGYVRLTISNGFLSQTQFEKGETASAYESYKLSIPGLYLPSTSNTSQNSFIKSGETCTIIMGKSKYLLKRHIDVTRALDTWRLYQGSIIDSSGTTTHRMWTDSDGEGAILEDGAVDFIGGFHGDEIYSAIDIIINGVSININEDYNITFDTLDIFVTSKLYHCNTVNDAFIRNKHLSFSKNVYTCNNRYTALSPFIVKTAAIALFNCYKQFNGVSSIYKYVDNDRRTLELIPQGTLTDGEIYGSSKLDCGTIYGNGFTITVKYLEDKLPEYRGVWTDFGTQNRIKLYLHSIDTNKKTLMVNDVLTSCFSVTIE